MSNTPLYRNKDYLLIVTASIISSIGSKMSHIALPLLALGLTQSPLWAGVLSAAQQVPYILFSIPAGVWVDRVNRKRLLIMCDLIRFVAMGSIPLAYALGTLHMLHLIIVVFISGTCTLLFEIADLAALPRVVEASQLAQARSISEGIEASATVLGPSIGGVVISLGKTTVSGAVLAFVVDSISYLVSGAALLGVRTPLELARSHEQVTLRESLVSGFRFLWQHPIMRRLLLLTSAVNFLQAPLTLGIVLIAQQRLGLGAAQIGLIFAVGGAAAVIGAMGAAWLYRIERLRSIVNWSLLSWIISVLVIAFAPNGIVLACGLALTQLTWPLYAVMVVSYRLSETPDAFQGRVISAFRTFSYGSEPLGLTLGGLALAWVEPSIVFAAIGVALVGCWLVLGRFPTLHATN